MFANKVVAFAGKVKAAVVWFKGLGSEERKLLYALLFVSAVLALCIAKAAFGDDAKYQGVYGWNLIEQPYNCYNRACKTAGTMRPIPCRADVDYIKGVIAIKSDCWSDGRYKTLAECKRSAGNPVSFYDAGADKWAGSVMLCKHQWLDPPKVAARG